MSPTTSRTAACVSAETTPRPAPSGTAPADPLSAMLGHLGLHARLDYVGGVCGRWAIDHNSDTAVWFHLVTKGEGFAHSPAWTNPRRLAEGDLLVFMPHAAAHFLSYSPDELVFGATGAAKVPLAEGSTGLVCGALELRAPRAALWRGLPGEILVRPADAGSELASLIALIVREAKAPGLASDVLIERLFDGCFLLLVRYCIERGLVREGLFRALQDARLAGVLALLHEAPAHPWSVAEICARGGLSRSVLHERFVALLGMPPMEYLAAMRMQLAGEWLRDAALSVEQVAERCGYESVSAFSRTFRRVMGQTPGAYRRGG